MGVFVSSSPFSDIEVGELFRLSSVQQLFLLGAVAIAVGVFTYSKRVMLTVGNSLMPLTPVAAFVVVLASSLVLFIFASTGLEHFLVETGLENGSGDQAAVLVNQSSAADAISNGFMVCFDAVGQAASQESWGCRKRDRQGQSDPGLRAGSHGSFLSRRRWVGGARPAPAGWNPAGPARVTQAQKSKALASAR